MYISRAKRRVSQKKSLPLHYIMGGSAPYVEYRLKKRNKINEKETR